MTSIGHDGQGTAHPESEIGPGKRLREARLAEGLSVEDVARRLHLRAEMIARLEQDDYQSLPAPTFVRGYLRSYARLLNLPPGPLLEAFDHHGLTPPSLVADIANKAEARSSDLPVRATTYVIVACLTALVVVWWQNNRSTQEALPEPVATSEAESEQADMARHSGGEAEINTLTSARDKALAESPPEPLLRPEEVVVISTAGDEGSAGVEAPAVVSEPRVSSGESNSNEAAHPVPLPGISTLPDTTLGDQAEADTNGNAPAPASTESDGSVLIRFAYDSWVEVYDRDGERLYYNLARGGSKLKLRGPAPLRVLLGYAREVRVEYNGAYFDHAPYMEKGLARFTLGQTALSSPVAAGGEAAN